MIRYASFIILMLGIVLMFNAVGKTARYLISAVLSVLLSVAVLLNSVISSGMLRYFVAALLIVAAVMDIIYAFSDKKI